MPIQGDLEKQRVGWRQDWMTTVADREAIVALLNEVAAEDIVEIGVHEGWTARCILDNVPTVKRYRGTDVLPNYKTSLPQQQRELPTGPGRYAWSDPRFELIIHPRGSLDVNADMIGLCDAVFIDGDHGGAMVMHDTALAIQCACKLIIWHDYGIVPSVTETIDGMRESGMPIKCDGTWLAYVKR